MKVRGVLSLLVVSSLAVCFGGCGKAKPAVTASESTASDPALTTNTDPASALTAAPVTPVVVEQGANVDAVLSQLTQAVRKYGFEKRRLPKTVEEVVAAGYVSGMPPAPAGKKFAIEPKSVQVVLVKQ